MGINASYVTIPLLVLLHMASCYCQDCADTSLCYEQKDFIRSSMNISSFWVSAQSGQATNTPRSFIDITCNNHIYFATRINGKVGISRLSGVDGTIVSTLDIPFFPFRIEYAIARDTTQFAVANLRGGVDPTYNGRLLRLDKDLNVQWISAERFDGDFGSVKRNANAKPALADFNQDGWPEVYIHNEIYSGQTGNRLINGGPNGIERIPSPQVNRSRQISYPVAQDLNLLQDSRSMKLKLATLMVNWATIQQGKTSQLMEYCMTV